MKLVFLDTETTGLKAWKNGKTHHEITELAVIVYENGKQTLKKSWKLMPRRIETADPTALKIGGFDPVVWKKDAIDVDAFWLDGLCHILDGGVIVGHNVKFDIGFLRALFKDFGIKFFFPPEFDTKAMAKMVWGFDNLRMDFIRTQVDGMTTDGAHRALKDTEDCVFIYKKYHEWLKSQQILEFGI